MSSPVASSILSDYKSNESSIPVAFSPTHTPLLQYPRLSASSRCNLPTHNMTRLATTGVRRQLILQPGVDSQVSASGRPTQTHPPRRSDVRRFIRVELFTGFRPFASTARGVTRCVDTNIVGGGRFRAQCSVMSGAPGLLDSVMRVAVGAVRFCMSNDFHLVYRRCA